MATLYEIADDLKALEELEIEAIDEETGEIKNPELLEQFENEIKMQLLNKAANIVKFSKQRDYFIENIDSEIKRLQTLKKTAENKQNNFKSYIVNALIKMNTKKIETEAGTLSVRKSESTDVFNEEVIPAKFTTIVQSTKISKAEIKKAIKAGEEVPGATLKINYSLNIK